MFIVESIAELVADDFSFANGSIYIGMGMTINPNINTTVCYEIAQFCSESAVDRRIMMLLCHHLPCRQVVGNHNNLLSCTLRHALLDELQTELVQLVILIYLNELPVVLSLEEIIQPVRYRVLIRGRNARPQGAEDEVRIINTHNPILVITHVLLEFPLPLHATNHYVIMTIIVMIAWDYEHLAKVC